MSAPLTTYRPPQAARRSFAYLTLRRAGSWPVGGRFGAALALGAAGFGMAPMELTLAGRAVVALDAFALVSLALIWCVLATADAGHTRAVAARESPGRVVAFVFVPVAVACSLSAVLLLLSTGMLPMLPPLMRALHVALAVGGVASAWLLLHTVFTLRYAHLYYTDGDGSGLDFPAGSARPNYLDFAYFGFGIGMTAQTSDVSICGSGLRYLPAIARQLYHCRDLGQPFDFLTWFEYAPAHAAAFEELLSALRQTPEWTFVDWEVDIRLVRA